MEMKRCLICGRVCDTEIHHMLHGSMRKQADDDGLVCDLCHECHRKLHDLGSWDRVLQAEAESRWLENNPDKTVDDFIKRYGKNFL